MSVKLIKDRENNIPPDEGNRNNNIRIFNFPSFIVTSYDPTVTNHVLVHKASSTNTFIRATKPRSRKQEANSISEST